MIGAYVPCGAAAASPPPPRHAVAIIRLADHVRDVYEMMEYLGTATGLRHRDTRLDETLDHLYDATERFEAIVDGEPVPMPTAVYDEQALGRGNAYIHEYRAERGTVVSLHRSNRERVLRAARDGVTEAVAEAMLARALSSGQRPM